MVIAQVTAKVRPELKRDFMKAAEGYDLPVSSLLAMLMRMVVEGKLAPEINKVQSDDTQRTPTLQAAAEKARAEYKAGKTTSLHQMKREL